MPERPLNINMQWVTLGGIIIGFAVQAVVLGMKIGAMQQDITYLKERPDVIERIVRIEAAQDHLKADMVRLWNRSGATRAAASRSTLP